MVAKRVLEEKPEDGSLKAVINEQFNPTKQQFSTMKAMLQKWLGVPAKPFDCSDGQGLGVK